MGDGGKVPALFEMLFGEAAEAAREGASERQEQAESSEEIARLGEAYSLAASRLAEMIEAEKRLAGGGKGENWVEEVLEWMNQLGVEWGMGLAGDRARAEALGSDLELATSDRRLVEEIAAMRYVLRKTLALAKQAQEAREAIRLTEIYGQECVRLVRLLRRQGESQGRIEEYLNEQVSQTLDELNQERFEDDG